MLGAILGAAGSYFGGKEANKSAEKQQKRMIAQLNAAAEELKTSYQGIIDRIAANPVGYAGSKTQAALYQPVNLGDSLRALLGGNSANLAGAQALVNRTNQGDFQQAQSRINSFDPTALGTLGNLGRQANSLSQGQLPQDVIQNIFAARAGSSGASGTPGGAAPAALRDLGLSSLDAISQGGSLLQQVIQGAEAISPISRLMSAQQYQFDPRTALQTDLSQALLNQQSQQNYFNLSSQADPGLQLQTQLMIQMANNAASTKAGIAGIQQAPIQNYGAAYAQAGNALGSGLQSLFGNLFGGGGNSDGGGWFG